MRSTQYEFHVSKFILQLKTCIEQCSIIYCRNVGHPQPYYWCCSINPFCLYKLQLKQMRTSIQKNIKVIGWIITNNQLYWLYADMEMTNMHISARYIITINYLVSHLLFLQFSSCFCNKKDFLLAAPGGPSCSCWLLFFDWTILPPT